MKIIKAIIAALAISLHSSMTMKSLIKKALSFLKSEEIDKKTLDELVSGGKMSGFYEYYEF